MAFDPYHKWLQIPPAEQPPHHYRLLGLAIFENDPDVIAGAADQRMLHVRTFQTGEHSELSQRILNEIATARLCLLNAEQKAVYDAELTAKTIPTRSAAPVPLAVPQVIPVAHSVRQIRSDAFEPVAQAPFRSQQKSKSFLPPGVIAGVAIAALVLIAVILLRRDSQKVAPSVAAIESEPSPSMAIPKASIQPEVKKQKTPAKQNAATVTEPRKSNPAKDKQPPASLTPRSTTIASDTTLQPGLLVRLFERLPSQSGNNGFIQPMDFDKPVGDPFVIQSTENWQYDASKNAVAFGYLKIAEPGEYIFQTYNWFDRNALYINGILVCPYRGSTSTGTDRGGPDDSQERILLTEGLATITILGYVDAKGTVRVSWKPPDQEGFSAIPDDLLIHDTGDAEWRQVKASMPKAEPSGDPPTTDEPTAVSVKLPIPDDLAIKQAKEVVRDVHRTELAEATKPESKSLLAGKLLQEGIETAHDDVGQYVLFITAHDMAVDAGDLDAAILAIDEADQRYQIDAMEMKATAAATILKKPRLPLEGKELIPQLLDLSKQAMKQDRYDLAKKFLEGTKNAARRSKNAVAVRDVDLQIKAVSVLEKHFAGTDEARKVLEGQPTDPDANLKVGTFLCFFKGDWKNGLRMLASGSDKGLKQLAQQEINKADEPSDYASLADGWWAAAEGRDDFIEKQSRLHAAYWYNRALPNLEGLDKAKAAKRIADIGFQPTPEGNDDDRPLDPKELRVLNGHTDMVRSVAFSADGRLIVSCGSDKTVRVWEVQTGRQLKQFDGHSNATSCAEFSPNGKFVVSGSFDGTLRYWSMTEDSPRIIGNHPDMRSVCFSSDGKRIVSAGDDGTIRIWELRSNRELLRIKAPNPVFTAALSPDDKYILSANTGDFSVSLWNASNGMEMHRFRGHTDKVRGVAFSPDGRFGISSSGETGNDGTGDNSIRLWDLKTGKEVRRFIGHAHHVWGICFVPDGRHIISASMDATLRLWNVDNGNQVAQVSHPNGTNCVAVSRDGALMASGGLDKRVRIWSLRQRASNVTTNSGQRANNVMTNSIGMKLAFIPAGEFLMGSPPEEMGHKEEEFQHLVKITKPYYLGIYEVTQAEYEKVMGTNPSAFSQQGKERSKVQGMNTARFPVEMVSWDEAVEFCRRLSVKERKTYRLPTEAEWEYACRAGTSSPFHFGSVLDGEQANCNGSRPYGTSTKGPNLERTTTVGSYPPNQFGLYDMHGNVYEWCSDFSKGGAAYYRNSPLKDPLGPPASSGHMLRGSAWVFDSIECRAGFRSDHSTFSRISYLGFRVVLSASGK